MRFITSFNQPVGSESAKQQRNKMLPVSVSGKSLWEKLRGSAVDGASKSVAVGDCVELRSVEVVEVPMESAAAITPAWQQQSLTVSLDGRANRSMYFLCKRCLDVCVAAVILLLLLPVFLFIAVLIKLDSNGPVFFTHERVGAKRWRARNESAWIVRKFGMHKFRSMLPNADPQVHEAYIRDFVAGVVQPESGGKFKLTNDPRVTRVGRLLRRTSLDELPQLFNVLKGDMSLVGPRPVPPYEVACYHNGEHKRLAAMPGVTGLWQVNGRCRVSFEEMIRMDLEYIRNASFWLDMRILFLTIPAVLRGRGAE
jgi:lipopolysaccharide/colanic/teichoic acid biosynthesis glycosyltransferase